tara:strand:- start:439 stop:966 length:528 start_codon:yes stop_codon:yes gene_type:complete
MTSKTISLNQKFKELLLHAERNTIGRKKLIESAENLFELTTIQAQRFVARNIHTLTKEKLIVATGSYKARTYLITPTLMSRMHNCNYVEATDSVFFEKKESSELLSEEIKTSAELKLILSEIQAYQDYMVKFPQSNETILSLLDKTRDRASDFYGRLSAIKKIIKASEIEGNITC